jgi:hypothetical protein
MKAKTTVQNNPISLLTSVFLCLFMMVHCIFQAVSSLCCYLGDVSESVSLLVLFIQRWLGLAMVYRISTFMHFLHPVHF